MNNAEKFKEIFKEFATEVWAFPEKDFLTWLNAEYEEPTTENDSDVQKAIEIIKADSLAPYSVNDILSARDLAVEALKQMTTTKNNLEVDCISRDSALKALDYDIKSFKFKSGISEHMDDIAKLLDTIYEIQENNIKALPSVTPQESKIGHWVHGEYCSECGCDVPAYIIDWKWQKDMDAKYCPNCGCRMVEPQESEVDNWNDD